MVDEKKLVILDIFAGEETPYYYAADGVMEAYIRIGNESVLVDDTEHKRLVLRGKKTSYDSQSSGYIEELCRNSIALIRYARGLVVQHINIIELMTYYALGKWIVEVQQEGNDRAKYGDRVIDHLSESLIEEFGRGYSRETLRNARKFYQVYQDRISQTLFTEFVGQKSQTLFGKLKKDNPFRLSWSHYLILMRVKTPEERDFYEIEAADGNWSVRTLQRQYGSSLYERLLLSTDKGKVKEIAQKGQIIERPQDVVNDPLILEFLGLQEKPEYSETELETRIIDHLQEFLMEMRALMPMNSTSRK